MIFGPLMMFLAGIVFIVSINYVSIFWIMIRVLIRGNADFKNMSAEEIAYCYIENASDKENQLVTNMQHFHENTWYMAPVALVMLIMLFII